MIKKIQSWSLLIKYLFSFASFERERERQTDRQTDRQTESLCVCWEEDGMGYASKCWTTTAKCHIVENSQNGTIQKKLLTVGVDKRMLWLRWHRWTFSVTTQILRKRLRVVLLLGNDTFLMRESSQPYISCVECTVFCQAARVIVLSSSLSQPVRKNAAHCGGCSPVIVVACQSDCTCAGAVDC